MLFCRETNCMSGHPCRAHHKLKWARKGQSGLEVLYELIPRSESSKRYARKSPLLANASPPAQTPQGQPCLTGVGNNPLTIPKHSRYYTSNSYCTQTPKAAPERTGYSLSSGVVSVHKSRLLQSIKPLVAYGTSFPFR